MSNRGAEELDGRTVSADAREGAENALELSVVVPLFNEEESVGPLIERICAAMAGFGKPWELLLIDDGSADATVARARQSLGREGLDLKIVELQRNFGQTAAMQAGIDIAAGRLIATMDGDLQND
ncbi:MAG: glycosyltransferase, partial [Rhizobiaceae bacterium]|nr:glycosyltransferase [Rhizobiaceae bacterium]